jgi:hypothetical protein
MSSHIAGQGLIARMRTGTRDTRLRAAKAGVEHMTQVIDFLNTYLVDKAPYQIPAAGKEWIVKYGPWIAIVLLILLLPPILLLLGLGAALTPFGGVYYATNYSYIAIVTLIQAGLTVAALPGLFARKMSGWTLLFYSRILAIVTTLLLGNVVAALLGGLIGLYILFQIRPLYEPASV